METFKPSWNIGDEIIVYSDKRYILGQRDKTAYLTICEKTYKLSCHPFEPCLYITDENNAMTAVHNAFDPFVVLELFYNGEVLTSITGLKYHAEDFCKMVEYALGMGDISISDAEKVFGDRQKEKITEEANKIKEKSNDFKNYAPQKAGEIIKDDLFFDIYSEYPDSVIDYCLIKNIPYCDYKSHRRALELACGQLFFDECGEPEWQYDLEKAEAKMIDADELFTVEKRKLTYRTAFLNPPYPNGYKSADFERVNDALFPDGRDSLEIYEWSTDWSEYFDDGHEWWGTLCYTVYDKKLDRFAVIAASATD